jgi:3-hydroxyacyl-[acyl-carrier-protein] dehydratase
LKNVTANENFFQGHFPGQAIMPGVLIVEAMAQVGGVMMMALPNTHNKLALLAGLDNVRFRRPVVPGDALITEATLTWFRRDIGRVRTIARVNGEIAAEADMTFALVDQDEFREQIRGS